MEGYRGVFTALVTPFSMNGSIDYTALGWLIDAQLGAGVNGIVPCGTTGEAPTLSESEQKEIIRFSVKHANGVCKVIAGTGTNSTAKTIELTKYAESVGADAALVVSPYYNKPTQKGLFKHFKAVADSVSIPIIIYNIKSRTGVNIETSTLLELANTCPNIVGVKEASGDLNQIREVIRSAPQGFFVLSGDDALTLEVIKSGGHGVISVASNIVPEKIVFLVKRALNKDYLNAEEIHARLSPLFSATFIETNPIPIKAMLAMKGMCAEAYRLPLCELSAESRKVVENALKSLNQQELALNPYP